jgi:hypothetical protein
MRRLFFVGTFLLFQSVVNGQQVQIKSPGSDSIVVDDKITVSGVVTGPVTPGTNVTLSLDGTTMTYSTAVGADGTWSIANVVVPGQTGNWTATVGSSSHTIVVTKGSGLTARPRQKVRFSWDADVDAEFLKMAAATLDAPLTADQQTAFVEGVRSQVLLAFVRAYAGIGVDVVDGAGPGVSTVHLVSSSGDIFGQSPYDFDNQDSTQTSEIWVGTFSTSMANDDWQPMKKSDSWQLRIIDVGEAIGRTCAHEFGHSLGLVGSNPVADGGWMRGCDDGHNCDQMNSEFPATKRFASGQFIMDPGGKSLPNARIGEASPTGRGTRQPAVFNAFNRSYFGFVQP